MSITFYGDIKDEEKRKELTLSFVIASQKILKNFAEELRDIKNIMIGDEIYLALGNIIDSFYGSDYFGVEEEFLDFKKKQEDLLFTTTNYNMADIEYIYNFIKKNIKNFDNLIIRMQEDFNDNEKFIQEYYDFTLIKNLIF